MRNLRTVLSVCIGVVVTTGLASFGTASDPFQSSDFTLEPFEGPSEYRAIDFSARKAAMLAKVRDEKTATLKEKEKDPKAVKVDCTKGDSLQAAIDNSADPVVIEVEGICYENVLVQRRDGLTIRGSDPEFDGIRGIDADPRPSGALEIRYSDQISIENLSMNDSPRAGLSTWQSSVTVENSEFNGNGLFGVYVVESSNFDGYGLTISDNGKYGLWVSRGSFGYCTGCEFQNNRYAAVSYMYSFVTLLQSVANASRGIWAAFYSYIDFDCYSRRDAYPEYPDCRLDAGDWAAVGQSRSETVMYISGPFTGSLYAERESRIWLYGAQQESVEGTRNVVRDTSALEVSHFQEEIDEGVYLFYESMLNGYTLMRGFSRATLTGATTLDGMVECADAADAWADQSIDYTGDSGFCNCEHATDAVSCPD